jgi:hypothetical protein
MLVRGGTPYGQHGSTNLAKQRWISRITAGGAGGARTHDRQIMRSTLDHNTRLTSNDAPRGYQERTCGTGSSTGAGPRPGPRSEALPTTMTAT